MRDDRHLLLLLFCAALLAPAAGAQEVVEAEPGKAAERQLPSDETFTLWAQDPELVETDAGDRLEEREVLTEKVETVKLTNVVPPIRFASGVAEIPPSYVQRLRATLDDMHHLQNVRLHLVGHADNQPLSDSLAGVFGDNAGLSRERAGEVAEFLQAALGLPPEAISFEWAGDRQPIATNATAEGRALNRRVEVEVWYDEVGEKLAVEEVVVPEEIKRVKVCRVETVCKLRYREGHAHRARVRNLITPLRVDDDRVGVPQAFIQQIAEALHNLRDKQNVTVKFVGFTDDAPLTGRALRIYGTHLALSKARAHRVALAVQDALDLPSSAIASDGRGSSRAVASNETAKGRALNRRVEVEFWHDDPLQELPDEPQPCPDAAGADLVTKVYDPPWGKIEPLPIEDGEASIPPGYGEVLLRAMADLADKTNVRLRFVGYTRNEHLDRRTALVYGDDIGLSAARARRTMERIRAELGLSPAQAEHEGRGYVHSNDVVNAGFLQGETSHVVVEIVYDELAVLDDYDGVEITPITRELRPKNPLGLNLMRITVDGEPIHDPGRSSADIQRCTDVALQRADLRFRFDNLESTPRLSVAAAPTSIPVYASEQGTTASSVRFKMYTNYASFIERAEVRIFERSQSGRAAPLAVVEIGRDGLAEWQPAAERFAGPVRELKYVLRAYDAEGRFDETGPQQLWMVYVDPGDPAAAVLGAAQLQSIVESEPAAESEPEPAEEPEPAAELEPAAEPGPDGEPGPDAELEPDAEPDAPPETGAKPRPKGLLAGYGESGLQVQSIPLGAAGTVEVQGSGIPPRHSVWLAGNAVPVDGKGNFAAEVILPSGMHTVEVAVLDEAGNGELFLRDLELERNDWLFVGVADFTLSMNSTSGPADLLTGNNAPYDDDSFADGRLAFYANGKFGETWTFTASADTREGAIDQLFSNFMDKSPESLFRRIDPDVHYPTFGDDGTVVEAAPTAGKLYLKLDDGRSHALWGNFKVGYLDNELAQIERGLYGANLRYQSDSTTSFGERKLLLDGFVAQPGTVQSREEFRGTGGSLYFLRRQDLLPGSERARIEVRDRDSGLVSGVIHLKPTLDYDIDYLQGRILLSQPLNSYAGDDLLVRSGGPGGDETWLVVQYEYTPSFDEPEALAGGGQGQYWVNDYVKLGLTAGRNDDSEAESSLYAGELTLRKSTASWLKLQVGRSDGLVTTSLRSDDGGFNFLGGQTPGLADAQAGAYRADLNVGVEDFIPGGKGSLSFYVQRLDAGYSAPGMTALNDTDVFGGSFRMRVTEKLHLSAKADRRIEQQGLESSAGELDVGYQLTDRWSLGTGLRHDLREDGSPIVPVTQEEGGRTDGVVQVAYDSRGRWRSYGFAQATLAKSEDREDNRRVGVGGAYRIDDRLVLDGEVSHGDLGPAVKLGTTYKQSENTDLYLTYALGDEQADTGLHARRGNLVYGSRTRLSDSASVYVENRYQHADAANGLTRAMGMTLAPADRWSVGASFEGGTLVDRRTLAETERTAGGLRVGYAFETIQLSSAVEYRADESEQLDGTFADRTTWLFRNNFKFQVVPDWRVVGKLNHSTSESSLGEFFDGGYTEGVLGFAYRPIANDRVNLLAKYTYFYNVPTADQLGLHGTPAEFLQKSHITSLDVMYDLTARWSIGAKYAYRLGQVSLDRENPEFFDNSAHLYILRSDLHFLEHWGGSVEARMLALPDVDEARRGALVSVYHQLGDNLKLEVGYNFTDFSEDLMDLSFNDHGAFLNVVGGW